MSNSERMWAPWRMQMIRAPKDPGAGCFLCEKPKQTDDKANLVLQRGQTCCCLMNLYPYTNCHLLVAPYRHTGNFAELTQDEITELMSMAQRWVKILQDNLHPDGVNLGMNLGQAAGAGVAEHLHLHIVPRWNGDTNFMTIMSDVRVINQSLEETWEELKAASAQADL